MPRGWHVRAGDMLGAIGRIERFMRLNFRESEVVQLAIERAFEILSEASRHIPTDIKAKYGNVRWQDLADLGNILRHAYHRVSLERLVDAAERDLPPLKAILLDIERIEFVSKPPTEKGPK